MPLPSRIPGAKPDPALLLGLVLAAAPAVALDGPAPADLDSLAIRVTREHPREVIYTDKGAGHFAAQGVGPDTRSYHGFYIAMHEVLDGWTLRVLG